MKKIAQILLLVMIAALSLSVIAQESTDEPGIQIDVPDDHEQVIIQRATAGTLEQIEGLTYTLTLKGLGDEFSWFTKAPELNAGIDDLEPMVLGWEAAEGLVAESAVLFVDEMAVILSLAAPTYDVEADVLVFQAEVSLSEGFEFKDLPEDFTEATLYIAVDAEFMRQLADGFITVRENARKFARLSCIMGRCG